MAAECQTKGTDFGALLSCPLHLSSDLTLEALRRISLTSMSDKSPLHSLTGIAGSQ
jgi:hypothetical protein